MSVWAHPCRRCGDDDQVYFVSSSDAAEFAVSVRIVRVKVGRKWLCAELDRSVRVEVESGLTRQVIATEAADCAGCDDE